VTAHAARLHTSSAGLDPIDLRPGRDLLLYLHPVHGTDAAPGTYVFDYMTPADRHAADRTALLALAMWRAQLDAPLTVEGVCWPFIWELALYELLNPAVARALGLRRALEQVDAEAIELADDDEGTAVLARTIGEALGIPVQQPRALRSAGDPAPPPPPQPRGRRLRQTAMAALTGFGAPTVLRRGSIAIHPYWPLMPLVDRMLDEPGQRPALFLQHRPPTISRSLRVAMRGGWIGKPTVGDRRRAREQANPMLQAMRVATPIALDGLELGAWLHPRLARLIEQRAAADLAQAAMLRRAFRSRRLRLIIGSYDIDPDTRLMVLLAREAGIHTFMLAHGAYLLPQPLADLNFCDEVALWTRSIAPPITNVDRPIHMIGYPVPHEPPPPTRRKGPRSPRIAVLGQLPVPSASVLDERITMRCYETALRGIVSRWPDATVRLRPHPTQERITYPALAARFPDLRLEEDTTSSILEFLRGVDLCIGGASAATLQGALVGTPVIALNLSGDEWPFPIGGRTSVAVACSPTDLEAILDRWAQEGTLPGREDLLAGLGADGSDPVSRLLALVDGAKQPTPNQGVHHRSQLPQWPVSTVGDRQQVD
jgi:hypothetical protein